MNSQTPSQQEITQLFQSSFFIVYHLKKQRKEYILKVANETVRSENLLKNEFHINKILNHIPGVREAYELTRFRGENLALLLEYVPYDNLAKYVNEQGTLDLKNFLQTALNITRTLKGIHDNNIVHKDIKPSNILYNPENNEIKIIDFSVSEVYSPERRSFHKNILVGTYKYMAPEQTGRLNSVVDFSSDLYSLGATFYKMLVGRPPFDEEDNEFLIYYHLTKVPERLDEINPEIPKVIADIVAKLLEKRQERRYQSASALAQDLAKALEFLEKEGQIPDFEIATTDVPSTLVFPSKPYGYQEEEQILTEELRDVAQNKTKKWIAIYSHKDYGTKWFIRRVQPLINEQFGIFVEAQFEKGTENPLEAIDYAMSNLLEKTLETNETLRDKVRREILRKYESIIAYLNLHLPNFSKLYPEYAGQQMVLSDAMENIQHKLIEFYVELMTYFSQELNVTVLALYNVEFADSASIRFLRKLIRQQELEKFLLITANFYQQENSKLDSLVESWRVAHPELFREIILKGHSEQDIVDFIKDTFKCSDFEAKELAKLLIVKYGKGLRAIQQGIKQLYQANLIYFDKLENKWKFAFEKIKAREGTQNVEQLLESKISTLPKLAQTILNIASLFGITFNLKELFQIVGLPFASFKENFEYLIRVGLVEPSVPYWNDVYEEDLENVNASFTNILFADKIKENIPPTERKRFHYKIGQSLLKKLSEQEIRQRRYEIVSHIIEAKDLFTYSPRLIDFLQEVSYIATIENQSKIAYESLKTLIFIGKDSLWKHHPQIAQNAYLLFLRVALENKQLDEFLKTLKILKNRKIPVIEVLHLYLSTIDKLMNENELELIFQSVYPVIETYFPGELKKKPEDIKSITSLLREIKVMLFQGNIAGSLKSILSIGKKRGSTITEELAIENIERLLTLPDVKSNEIKLLMDIFARLLIPGLAKNINISAWSVYHLIRLAVKYGNSPAAVAGYAAFGAFFTYETDKDFFPAFHIWRLSNVMLTRYPENSTNKIIARILINVYTSPRFENISDKLTDLTEIYNNAVQQRNYFLSGFISVFDILHNLLSATSISSLKILVSYYETQLRESAQSEFLKIMQFYREWLDSLEDASKSPTMETYKVSYPFMEHIGFFLNQMKFFLREVGAYSVQWAEKAKTHEIWVLNSASYIFSKYIYALTLLQAGNYNNKQKEEISKIQNLLKLGAKYSTELEIKYLVLEALEANNAGKTEQAYEILVKLLDEKENYLLPFDLIIIYEELLKLSLLLNNTNYATIALYKLAELYRKSEMKQKLSLLVNKYKDIAPDIDLMLADDEPVASDTESLTTTNTGVTEKGLVNIIEKVSASMGKAASPQKMLLNILKTLLFNSGADRICVMQTLKEDMFIITDLNNSNVKKIKNLEKVPFSLHKKEFPSAVITYVNKTKRPLFLLSASQQYKNFEGDSYIQQKKPQALYCTPILSENELLGIIYMEYLSGGNFLSEFELEKLVNVIISYLALYLYGYNMTYKIELEKSREIQALKDFAEDLKKHNALLSEKIHVLQNKLAEITHSIEAAARIQRAILKTSASFQKHFSKAAVFWRPHSIVSGDFFYYHKEENEAILIVGDCTGHGVPAAQLTIVGTIALQYIIEKEHIKTPAAILQELDRIFYEVFYNDSELTSNAGMDVSVIRINTQTKTLTYAGANAPIVYTDGEKLLGMSPTKLPIGAYDMHGKEKTFKEKTLQLSEQTKVYLFSDGFRDQVGGHEGVKLGKKFFYKLLFTVSKLPWEKQSEKLGEAFDKWKGAYPQTDDVLVLGIQPLQE